MDTYDANDPGWPAGCHQAAQLEPRSRPATIVRIGSIQQRRKTRLIANPASISFILVAYIIISDQSLLTKIMSKNLIISQKYGLDYNERSLIGLASANPAPEPAPAGGRSATSGSHRIPPMNGSIFGKRSVAGTVAYHNGALGSDSHSMNTHRDQRPTTTTATATQAAAKSEQIGYKDIITETIEEFLALNNESNPEEASVAFCRMIVMECRQMLSAKMRRRKGRRHENRR